MVKVHYEKESPILDEPFHRLRNKIIEDLIGVWTSGSYWTKFRDKPLLQAVMTRMQARGELISRCEGAEYEWMVKPSTRRSKIIHPNHP